MSSQYLGNCKMQQITIWILLIQVAYFTDFGDNCEYCNSLRYFYACSCSIQCSRYGNCCNSNNSLNGKSVEFKCLSPLFNRSNEFSHVLNGILMVSSCPSSADNNPRSDCFTSGEPLLPPVTDITTGIVYRNEHCARCNGISDIVAWGVRLNCSDYLKDEREHQNISDVLVTDFNVLRQECKPLGFVRPHKSALPFPRECTITTQTCLPFPKLGLTMSQYNELVSQCKSGTLEPVLSDVSPLFHTRDRVAPTKAKVHFTRATVYYNRACAACNRETSFKCARFPMSLQENNNSRISNDFTIVIRSLDREHILVDDTIVMAVSCPEGQVPVGLECRPTKCPNGYTLNGGSCSHNYNGTCLNYTSLENASYVTLQNDRVFLNSKFVAEVLDYDALGRPVLCKPLNCSTGLVALNRSEYKLLENGSIIFQNTLLEVMHYDELNRTLICPELVPSASLTTPLQSLLPTLPGIRELTYIGCSFSIIGTTILLLTYSLFSELRTYPGLILMNLCSAILVSNLVFVIGGPILHFHPIKEICSALIAVLHYSYLAQFSWMSIFSFEVMRTLYLSRKLAQTSKETKRKLYFFYSAIAWIIPLIVVAVSIVLNYTTNLILYGVNEQGQTSFCWINQRESLIIVFILPLVLSLTLNIIMFIVTSVLLCLAWKNKSSARKSNSSALIRMWIAAFLITGLTWIFGFVALLSGSWVWYLFVIFNNNQGLGISIVFIVNKNILGRYMLQFKEIKQIKRSVFSFSSHLSHKK